MMIAQGTMINERYRIVKMIGDGGMANVYLANDLILNREVAIKVLRHELSDDATFIKRFEREARAVTSLSHPNIVSIYDIGNDKGYYYIVMEYIEGKTLKHLIQERQSLTVTETLALMKQIIAGVAHAHNHGIIHRDLKPQNILLKRDGTVKITDFGIALSNTTTTTITKTNSIMGSVHYLAPEIARGDAASIQSDIYSLGIIMYEMLSGKLPFRDSAPVAVVMKHMREPFPSVRDFDATIPQSVENTIMLATAKSKRNRFRTTREFYASLQSALNSRRMNEPRVVFTGSDRSENYELNQSTRPVQANERELSEKKPVKKLRIDRILAVVFIAMATLFVIGIGFFALSTNTKPKTVLVPDVASKTVDEAKIALENEKLKVDATITYAYSDTVAKDRVIETNPKNSQAVDEGTKVSLTVSKGVNFKIDYSKMIGKSQNEVKALLDSNGVKYTITEQFDNQNAGTVIAIDLKDGQLVDGGTVGLTISKGIEQVVVPNFSGMTLQAAQSEAERVGIKVKYYEEKSSTVKKGSVISQNTAAGSSVNKGSSVTVVISSGAPVVITPPTQTETPTNSGSTNSSGSTTSENQTETNTSGTSGTTNTTSGSNE